MFDSVPKHLYEEALAGRRAAEARCDALFRDTVPSAVHEQVMVQMQRQLDMARVDVSHYVATELHEAIVEALRQQLEHQSSLAIRLQDQLEKITTQAMDLKRAEQGIVIPSAKDLEMADPLYGLGEKVRAAIEEFSAGDVETRKQLIYFAHSEIGSYRANMTDGEADAQLGARILAGDSGDDI